MRRLLFAVALIFGLAAPAWAQAPLGSLLITQVDATAFPAMTLYLAASGADGQRLAGLPAGAFGLTENGAAAGPLTVTEEETGVQVVFVLDPSLPFTARDAAGVPRLDYLKQALTAYAAGAPGMKDEVDDVTLLAPAGALAEHSLSGAALAAAAAAYGPPLAEAADPLPLLNRAVDYAAETARHPGARRYVVYFSNSLVIADHQAAVNDLAVRANAAQIQIDTVYLGPAEGAAAPGGQGLQQLAHLTNGAFYLFEKPASLTPLFQILADQRQQYKLTYRSALNVTGQHTLLASVTPPGGAALTSPPGAVALRIEPPLVTLGDLPVQMEQTVTPVAVPFAVDFSDNHPRALKVFQLVVDGAVVDQEIVATGVLRWLTAGYTQSGEHTVAVRATDELGLVGESAPRAVTVNVNAPAAIMRTGLFSPLGLAALAGAAVLLGFGTWFVARARVTRPRAASAAPPSAPEPSPAPKAESTPASVTVSAPPVGDTPPRPTAAAVSGDTRPVKPVVTAPLAPPAGDTQPRQPLADVLDDTRPVKPVTIVPAATPVAPAAGPAPALEKVELGRAYLEVLEPGGGGAPRPPVEILKPVLKMGRDPAQSEIVFDDRSVSRLHARLEELGSVFRLYDEHSTSGTWVNLEQIPLEGGRELQDGDVLNLGRVQLRFRRRM